jgi:hypothetical protein
VAIELNFHLGGIVSPAQTRKRSGEKVDAMWHPTSSKSLRRKRLRLTQSKLPNEQGDNDMAFNLRKKPKTSVKGLDELETEARNELIEKGVVLNPIPEPVSTLGKLAEYYIKAFKKDSKDKTVSLSGNFNTRNITYVLSLIMKYGYHILYLKRSDGRILLDKR